MEATRDCVFLPENMSALRLRDARDEDEYGRLFARLLHYRNHVDTQAFHVARRDGFVGGLLAKLRLKLWRVLRYQHDRMFFRQNLVNSHMTALLEAQASCFSREIEQLRARIDAMEERPGSPAGRPDSPRFRISA